MAIAMAYNMGIAQFNYTSNYSFANLKNSARLAHNCRELRGCNYRKKRVRMNVHQVKAAVNGDVIRGGADDHHRKNIAAQQLDHWLHNSVVEIVKNIGEAPFLVHIYTDNNGLGSSPPPPPSSSYSARNMKFVIQKTTQEAWPIIKQRWESSYSEIPHGIILVEQLESKDNQQEQHDKSTSSNMDLYPTSTSTNTYKANNSNCTKLWGVLVQGRDLHFPACYLLKTCQVQCCFGFSTHFCLAKVDNFGMCSGGGGTSFDFHLNKMWLQR